MGLSNLNLDYRVTRRQARWWITCMRPISLLRPETALFPPGHVMGIFQDLYKISQQKVGVGKSEDSHHLLLEQLWETFSPLSRGYFWAESKIRQTMDEISGRSKPSRHREIWAQIPSAFKRAIKSVPRYKEWPWVWFGHCHWYSRWSNATLGRLQKKDTADTGSTAWFNLQLYTKVNPGREDNCDLTKNLEV